MHHASLDARAVAAALGGEVASPDSVLAPGPGHSPKDRSLSVKLDPDAPEGFTCTSFAGDDWRACRDHVRERLGRGPWTPGEGREASRRETTGSARRKVAEYVYRLEDGTPFLRVDRWENPKSFPQYHWTGSGWAKGKPKGPKVPYRLPELLASPHAPIFVAEGEKDADTLHRLGLLGTTSSEGAGKWSADLDRWFAGRTVYVLPDNDEPGRSHARQVASHLHRNAAEVRVVALLGLPEKGDVSDWLRADDDVEELLRLCQTAPLWRPAEVVERSDEFPPARTSRFHRACDLHGQPVPAREWLVPDAIPARTVTGLDGDGGTGKSLLLMQLAVATARGARWLGREVAQGGVVYLSAEDDEDELHRRFAGIVAAEGGDFRDLGDLTYRSLAGEDALLALDTPQKLEPTALLAEVEAAVQETPNCRLLGLDTRADLYPANENDRAKVRQFIGILRGFAIRRNCAVVLLGHPSLSGLSSGSGSSGSTAWNNSVRSRLYLERIRDESGHEPNPDRRRLRTMKANYAPVGGEIMLRWERGVFVAEEEPAQASGLDRMATGAKAERVFLALLDEFTAQGRYVSPSPSTTYAPTLFASHPKAEGMTKRALKAAMETLFSQGSIVVAKHGRGASKRDHITRAGEAEHGG